MAAEGNRVAVVNVTVAHAPDRTVETEFVYDGDGAYRFVVTTVPAEKAGSPDCRTGSSIAFVGTLPADFRNVTVVYDGRVVGTVENTPDPTYRPLWIE